MRQLYILAGLLVSLAGGAQELYVYSEPASNMPAKSIAIKLSGMYMDRQEGHTRSMQRYMPEVMFGFSKKLMAHVGFTFGDMHTPNLAWESLFIYGKYRFLSNDDIHRHFRMAAFVDASYSRVPFHNDEISLQGDKSGIQLGLIATQLWHKFALSGTASHTQVLHSSRNNKSVIYVPSRIYQSLNYNVSAGYLLLPREYTDYRQVNLNLYTEFLGQQSLDRAGYYLDMAPAIQLIFNSNTKINLGYRFQLTGNMSRMAQRSWLFGIERTFLNALR